MTTTSLHDLASRLRLTIGRTSRRLRQESGGGLSPSQNSALVSIDRRGPLTPSELADCERVSRPTATRMLARLEEEGLVTRAADPRDKRSALISLSPTGRALLGQVREAKDAYLEQRMAGLSAAELATLAQAAEILDRLLDE